VRLAVGAPRDRDGGGNRGALFLLGIGDDGRVKTRSKISQTAGGFGGALIGGDHFGSSVASLGDLDGDGNEDLAVGAEGASGSGAVWILFLAADGSVADEVEIDGTTGGFGGVLGPNGRFGASVARLDDLDGDGVPELAVGAPDDDTRGSDQGAVWILFLRRDGTVRDELKLAERTGGFRGQLSVLVRFGTSLTSAELDGNGVQDLLVGASGDGDFGLYAGAAWALELEPAGRTGAPPPAYALPGGARRR
jgi:hypothetical protein